MRLRILCTICFIILLSITSVHFTNPSLSDDSVISTPIDRLTTKSDSLEGAAVSLVWTSRWSATPQDVHNDSTLVGDHILLNATFAENSNVTRIDFELLGDDMSNFTSSGSNTVLDTYSLGANKTVDITVRGYTSTNETVVHELSNVSICNFFEPMVILNEPQALGYNRFNFSWNSFDLNQDDETYYSVWLSSDYGLTYMNLGLNLTDSIFVWDSSGFLERYYSVKVRGYSLDFSYPDLCDVDNPPASYWPGDWRDSEPIEVYAGDVTTGPGPFMLYLNHPNDIIYLEHSIGNLIIWEPTFSGFSTTPIEYVIYRNGTLWTSGEFHPNSDDSIEVNVDGLIPGVYRFAISIWGLSDSVLVTVNHINEPDFPWSLLIHYGAIGVSIGSSIIIITVVMLSIRLRKKHATMLLEHTRNSVAMDWRVLLE
jgi:hypothetical protein